MNDQSTDTKESELTIARRKPRNHYGDLFLLIGLCLSLTLLVYSTRSSLPRVIAGGLCIFFAPGYVLLAALYPDQRSISQGQRLSASVGISVVVSSLLYLAAAYSLGITPHSSLGIVVAWILAMGLVAGLRRYRTPRPDRLVLRPSIPPTARQKREPLSKWLRLGQIAAILVLGVTVGRLLWISSRTVPQFTEFYLLGSKGLAGGYPKHTQVGHPITVTIGIVHHGKNPQSYDLLYRIDNEGYVFAKSVVLDDGEQWESEVEIYPLETSKRQKIVFDLHKEGQEFPYDTLHLWIDVSE
jgi:uncharacterized membrane protein